MGKFEVMAKGALPVGDTGHQARADKDQQPAAAPALAPRPMPRKYRAMFKEIAWLIATIILVICTYCWGRYVAIAAVSACVSAMGCRIIHYITMKERKSNGCC